ncbi:MAG: hypothetical protein ABSG53_23805 [Thermoguttaceae bacterium]|jgi:hypothetical protein
MKRVPILVIGLVILSAGVNLAVAQEHPAPPKLPKGDVSRSGHPRPLPFAHHAISTCISGDYDFHPDEGVQKPLATVTGEFCRQTVGICTGSKWQ